MDPAAKARLHFNLRFSVATATAFILCEYMGWQPSMLAPVLTGVLLANLPFSPPFKLGLGLVIIMAVCAWSAFFLTTLLAPTPEILVGAIGLILFMAFAVLAQNKAKLPVTLLLLCIAVIPVATLTVPQFAGLLPGALVRAMAIAVLLTWVAYAIWPLPLQKAAAPASLAAQNPAATAAVGTAVVLPMMLVYLLFGLTDAIPVLLTTIMLVANLETSRGAENARAMLIANFLGGFVAVAAFHTLQIAPTLLTLAIITFLIGCAFASHIARGGAYGANSLLGYNASIVIFALALVKGTENSGTWGSRVVQFAIACLFAVGMLQLFMPLALRSSARARKPLTLLP